MKTLRIFISSPGDVAEERDKAKQVIADLQRRYDGQATLLPVLWEDLAIPATASFQEGIDYVLAERHRIDIAVFILWSRLGSQLGDAIKKLDGTPYLSGTEREFDLMLTAFEQSGGKVPIILAYTRSDEEGFNNRLDATRQGDEALEELLRQRKLVKVFIRENFQDKEGHNLRAYHSYPEPVAFAQRLHVHLRGAVDDLLELDNTAATWTEAPYRSLEVFDIQHAPIFCGRDEETCDLLQRLRDQGRAGCAFVCIVGASGSGKSSLARAGVAATLLQRSFDDGVKEWRAAVFLPSLTSGDLVLTLARILAEPLPELRGGVGGIERFAMSLKDGNQEAASILLDTAFKSASNQLGGSLRLLLVLDQVEELWTDRSITPEQREKFLCGIESLARSTHLSVLATLRSDFYPQAQLSGAFLRMKGERGHFDLTPPGPASLQQLIVQPAHRAGLRFERDERTSRTLDQRILEDAARDPSALPLLQYALAELHESREEKQHLLTFAAYEAMGGVEGALGQRAAQTFEGLPAESEAVLNELLPLLISVDIVGEQNPVRRRAPLSDLADIATSSPRAILTMALIKARFLTTDEDKQSGTPIATLAHEALLRRWDRITTWINTNRELLRMRARIEQYQAMWEQSARDASRLLPAGLPLEEGRKLLAATTKVLNVGAMGFILASARHQDEIQRRSTRRRRLAFATLSVLTVFALTGALWAWKMQRVAIVERDAKQLSLQAEATQRALAEEQSSRNQRLLVESARSDRIAAMDHFAKGRTRDGLAYLARSLKFDPGNSIAAEMAVFRMNSDVEPLPENIVQAHDDVVGFMQFSPDGTRMVTGSLDKTAKVWEASSGKLLATMPGHNGWLTDVQFSPDGNRLVTASLDHSARVWDAWSGKTIAVLQGHTERVMSAQFSLDGRWIVTSSGDKTARVWESESGRSVATLTGHKDGILTAQFSPDGIRIVTGNDKTARVWETISGRQLAALEGHAGDISSAQFSPDGKLIVTGSDDKTARVWDAQSGKPIAVLKGHDDGIDTAQFSPAGTRILTASKDKTARVWDAASGNLLVKLEGHEGRVFSATYSADLSRVLTASADKTARVWDAATGKLLTILQGHQGEVSAAVFSPDGSRIATASFDGTVRMWETANQKLVATLRAHGGEVTSAQFSPDGNHIVSASSDETGRIWNAANGLSEALLNGSKNDKPDLTSRLLSALDNTRGCRAEFNADGKRIVTTSHNNTAIVWETAGAKRVCVLLGHHEWVNTAQFNGSGSQVVTASKDKTAKVWSAADGVLLASLEGHKGDVRSAQFSPDGKRIVTASDDKTARVWDPKSGETLHELEGHGSAVTSALFSPGGNRIITLCWEIGGRTVRLWDAQSARLLATLPGNEITIGMEDRMSQLAGFGEQFSPDGRRVAIAATNKTVRVWDVESGKILVTLRGHEGSVESVRFSPDGERIATGSADKTARLWDAWSGALLATLRGHDDGIFCAEFSPDGNRVVTASKDMTLRVWETPRFAEPPPSWFGGFIQCVAQRHLNEEGELVDFPSAEWLTRRSEVIESAKHDTSRYGDFARWFLAPAAQRPVRPGEIGTQSDTASGLLLTAFSGGEIQRIHLMDPSLPLNALALSIFEVDPVIASFQRAHSLSRLESMPTANKGTMAVLWDRASTLLGGTPADAKVGVGSEAVPVREEQLRAAEQAVSLNPESISCWRTKTLALFDVNRNVDALAAGRKVLAMPGATMGDFTGLGAFAAKIGQLEDSKRIFRDAATSFPSAESIPRQEGWSLLKLNLPVDALAAFRRSEAIDFEDQKLSLDLVAGIAIARWLIAEFDGAVQDYMRLIFTDKQYADIAYVRKLPWQPIELDTMAAILTETLKRHPELAAKKQTPLTTVENDESLSPLGLISLAQSKAMEMEVENDKMPTAAVEDMEARNEFRQNRVKQLAGLTLRRFREADRKSYGSEKLAADAAWSAKIMHEELHLDAEALELINFAIDITPPEKLKVLPGFEELQAKIKAK